MLSTTNEVLTNELFLFHVRNFCFFSKKFLVLTTNIFPTNEKFLLSFCFPQNSFYPQMKNFWSFCYPQKIVNPQMKNFWFPQKTFYSQMKNLYFHENLWLPQKIVDPQMKNLWILSWKFLLSESNHFAHKWKISAFFREIFAFHKNHFTTNENFLSSAKKCFTWSCLVQSLQNNVEIATIFGRILKGNFRYFSN